MKSAWKWGGLAILQAGLVVCLAAGAWAAEKSTYRSESAAPRAIQPILDEGGFNTADQQDPAPPAPPDLGKAARPEKLAPAPTAPKAEKPAAACGACESCDSCGSCKRSWFDIGCDDDDCGPKWTVGGGAMVLHRSSARNYVIGNGPIETGDIDHLGWAAGPRVDVTRHFERWDVELLYWSVQGWGQEVTTHASIRPPMTEMAGYASGLHNVEFNFNRKLDAVTLIFGTRYMELSEKLHDEERGLLFTPYEEFRTVNYLLGVQVGAEADIWCRDRVKVSGFTKVGLFSNHLREWHEIGIGPISYTADNTRSETGFVTEFGLTGTVQLTKGLSAYAGYEVMWLDGVVLAPDELRIQEARTNTPLYHGTSFGLEFRW